MGTGLLLYNLGEGVEAFSTRINSELPYHVIQPHQVHGDKVAIITDRMTTREQLEGIDALITNLTECPIGVRSADCVPILLYDVDRRVVAAIHSGWRGTVKKIAHKTIIQMSCNFGTKVDSLHAVIGPSIGPDSFQVKDDVVRDFCEAGYPMNEILFNKSFESKPEYYIDLWKANRFLLEEVGLKLSSIYVSSICSYLNHTDFYSARYLKDNKCGRTISAITLKANS